MLHVSCAESEARCYQLAGEQCPSGYDLARTAGRGQNYLVRCRVPANWQAGSGWGKATSTALPRPSPYQRSGSPVLAPSPYGSPPMPSPYPPLGSTPTDPSDIKESLDVGY